MKREDDAAGIVLIFAHADDPVTSRFASYAADRGVFTWQPANLEDIAWSFCLEAASHSLELHDRHTGCLVPIETLAGIWFQSMPPLMAHKHLDPRDRRYVASEFNSSARLLWHQAPCPVIGQPPSACPPGIFDFGLESRVQLRRLGIPALADRVGSLSSLRASLSSNSIPDDCVRITRTDGASSFWLSELRTVNAPVSELEPGIDELLAATITDRRPARIAVHVDSEVLVVEIDNDGLPLLLSQDEATQEIQAIARSVYSLTGARVGVTYFGHQQDGWMVARASLQIPYWLIDPVAPWLFPRVLDLFQASNRAPAKTRLSP